jgi:septum formation protein
MAASKARLILASASPRRRELLRNAGFEFEVCAADVDERAREGENPRAMAERLAREKARAVRAKFPGDFVLGADTVVVVADEILGKPNDAEDAARMLRLLSGREHEVITGVCVISPDGCEDTRSEITKVFFTRLSEDDIAAYVASGEPMDKAGAYGIQGTASRWIPKISGDYFNVVGLPVALVTKMLRESGWKWG